MVLTGNFSLHLALVFSLLSLIMGTLGISLKRQSLVQISTKALYTVFFLLTIAVVSLLHEIIINNFNVEYVASYSSSITPLAYKVTALWGGQQGSLLFWVWILSVYTAAALFLSRKRELVLLPYVGMVLALTLTFFTYLVSVHTNPFDLMPAGIHAAEGRGLNPLLQNLGMAIHPPLLYIGFIGFSVPFAFAIAALYTGRLDNLWLQTTRKWTLFAWLFLTAGIVVGMAWAYVVLGWGGYWGWDPVENASLIPWLTGTAYLHSVIIQEKRNMLRTWNMVLILLTFLLTIWGTFITRSGLISSVHSFANSGIGPIFVNFMGIVAVISIALLVKNLGQLKSANKLESPLSRESSFLLNNIVFLGIAFAVLWGTVFPMITEAVRGVKITVGPPFFNQINVPVGIVLLALMGITPLFTWRRTATVRLLRNLLYPILLSLAAMLAFYLLGLREFFPLTTAAISVFVTLILFIEFYRGMKTRMKTKGESALTAFVHLIGKNKRRYGGYIVHFGVVLIFVGFIGSAFNDELETVLKPGQDISIGKYHFVYQNYHVFNRVNHQVKTIALKVDRNGKDLGTLNPEKRLYFVTNQPNTNVDFLSNLKEDVYVVLADLRQNDGSASIKILINPLVLWIWIGSLVMIAGTFVAISTSTRFKKEK